MTATTKEQRADMRRLLESDWFKTAYHVGALPSLLSDSERLAAIEAVTGEEVRELVVELLQYAVAADEQISKEHGDYHRRIADTLLSLSAKVAEQAEEIERLAERVDDIKWSYNLEVKLRGDAEERARSLMLERDTLRRLLTETAVPAFEHIASGRPVGGIYDPQNTACNTLSTIRAKLEGATAPCNNWLSRQMDDAQARVAAMPESLRDGLREQMEGGNA